MEGRSLEWSSRKHVVRAFDIPSSWRKFRSIDALAEMDTQPAWFALDYFVMYDNTENIIER